MSDLSNLADLNYLDDLSNLADLSNLSELSAISVILWYLQVSIYQSTLCWNKCIKALDKINLA